MPLDEVHEVERRLRAAGVPSPRVDAEILVADVLGIARSELYSSNSAVTSYERERLDELVRRRIRREPLPYLLGEWGFRRLLLTVDERALIPRPETEVVVERCLAFLDNFVQPRVLDVGVGSGAAFAPSDGSASRSLRAIPSVLSSSAPVTTTARVPWPEVWHTATENRSPAGRWPPVSCG